MAKSKGITKEIRPRTTGEELPCDPIPDHIMELVARGGLVEYLKERIQKNA